MDQATTQNPEEPRLMRVPNQAQTRKPEELVDQPITILSQEDKPRQDGNGLARQWVVRTASGEVAPYWAPGTWPPIQVQQWFEENPGRPLYCVLQKTLRTGARGFLWELVQRMPSADNETTSTQTSLDQQLMEVGL